MYKNILYSLIGVLLHNFAYGQDIIWQKEYGATINEQFLANAYSGGVQIFWPRPALVDIDNDKDLDLFVGTSFGIIRFYRNDGDLTKPLLTLVTDFYESISVLWPAAPTFCDIDKDGDFDLFIGNGYEGCLGGTIIFYRNIGTPETAKWIKETENFASVDVCDNSVPTFADIDGDSDFDLFVGGGYGKIAFYRNVGNPQIAMWDSVTTEYNSIDVGWKSTPTFVDIDADNDLDLFVSNDTGNLYFYRNDGNPVNAIWKFVTSTFANIDFGWLNYTTPAFADIDADHDFDLLFSEHFGNINFYRNIGSLQNPEWLWESGDFIGGTIDVGVHNFPTFADIDTDGDFDMFIGKPGGYIRFYRNTGNPMEPRWSLETEAFSGIHDTPGDWIAWVTPIFVDIDNDGDLDLFSGSKYGGVKLYRNEGMSINPTPIFLEADNKLILAGYYTTPTFADLDSDGDFDLFIGHSEGTIHHYLNVGNPDSAIWSFRTEMYDSIDVGRHSKPVFADIDKDRDLDLFVGGLDGRIFFYRNAGDSALADFTFVTNFYNSIDVSNHSSLTFIDIDADRDLDLFIGEWYGGIHFFRNLGVSTGITHNQTDLPSSYFLTQNYPNPFNPVTTISYHLPRSTNVKITVYTQLGQSIATLLNKQQEAGSYSVQWDGKDEHGHNLPSGLYVYKLEAGSFNCSKKMLLLR